MTINLSADPYYDDFNEFKNFHQILFRPGYAVQARELTQLQSILRNQIAKFGNHIFQHGSVVIPGNTSAELAVPCILMNPLTPSGASLLSSNFDGQIIIGETSGVKAIVKKTRNITGTDPITFYINYLSGGSGGTKSEFDAGENIYVQGAVTTRATITSKSSGSLAYVNAGVYYINGTFVSIEKQTAIISPYSTTPSAHVMLKITEEIVTSVEDETLLDPAQGTYNFAAPGADRLKVSLTLTTLPLGTVFSDNDYVELMRYNVGVLEEHSRYPKYSELEKSLARRTYDESGDYIVSGYETTVREHLRSGNNGGLYVSGDTNKMLYTVNPGKGYIGGHYVETLPSTRIETYKARPVAGVPWTQAHTLQDSYTSTVSYGQYITVYSLVGYFDIENRESVNLYDISATTGGNLIGTANVMALDYWTGDAVTAATTVYKLYLYNVKITSKTIDDVGSVRGANGSVLACAEYDITISAGTFANGNALTTSAGRTGTVVNYIAATNKIWIGKNSSSVQTPKSADVIIYTTNTGTLANRKFLVGVGQNSVLFKLPSGATTALKNASNINDLTQTTFRRLVINAGQTVSNSISTGTILPIEAGNFIAVDSTGILNYANFSVTGGGLTVTKSTAAANTTYLYVQVRKTAQSPRTKTLTTTTDTKTSAALITLNNKDIFKVVSITGSGGDYTASFDVYSGQTDFTYEYGYLKLKNGYSLPSGTLSINYQYFAHTAGDFFTADSYSGLGAGYLDQIPVYVSPVDSSQYNLRDCIDYRFDGTGTAPVIDSLLTSSVQRSLSRIDAVILNVNGDVQLINGTPSLNPKVPNISNDVHLLSTIYVPAYTYKATDTVNLRTAVVRSTMSDIANVGRRLTNVENYISLTALESVSIQTNVLDAKTGLSRYKTGYLTENMASPLEIADYLNSAFSASFGGRGLTAGIEGRLVPLAIVQPTATVSSNAVAMSDGSGTKYVNKIGGDAGYAIHTGGVVTLGYTETVFASQKLSSQITNLNPFYFAQWQGNLKLSPNGDNWYTQVDLPDVVNNIHNSTTITNTVVIPCPPAPPPPPPQPAPVGIVQCGPVAFTAGPYTEPVVQPVQPQPPVNVQPFTPEQKQLAITQAIIATTGDIAVKGNGLSPEQNLYLALTKNGHYTDAQIDVAMGFSNGDTTKFMAEHPIPPGYV